MSIGFINSINGSLGELSIEFTLQPLINEGAQFLKNVYIPKENGTTTEIDLIMLYKGEIYVFESKNFSGWIFGNAKSKQWTQCLKGRRGRVIKNKFYNPIIQNENHIKYLKHIVGYNYKYNSIVVFSDRCEFKEVNCSGCSTYVTKRIHILELVRAISRDTAYSFEMTKVYNILYPYTYASKEIKKKHIEDVKTYKKENKNKSNNKFKNAKSTEQSVTGTEDCSYDLGNITSVPLQYMPRMSSNTTNNKVPMRKSEVILAAAIICIIVLIILILILYWIL